MSHRNLYQGPFIKAFYANSAGTANRLSDNPAFGSAYTDIVPSPLRRVYLVIQNKGTSSIELTLSSTGAKMLLYAGQAITFDNYNGMFDLSSYANAAILEAFE